MSVAPEVPVDNPALAKPLDASEPPACPAKGLMEKDVEAKSQVKLDGLDEEERLDVIRQVEFYFSDANLPFDKFMFLQTSPHLDAVKAPNLSAEAKKKAEAYGPGCSPVLLQTVASFKRMRQFSSKFPTSKLAEILQTSPTDPRLIEVITEELNGQPTFYVRRLLKLEESNRAGASDHCVYAKGFLSEEDLAKREPKDIQIRLEKWAKQWGPIGVLRMRRENSGPREAQSKDKKDKKWKNSVFIEYREPSSAERLVREFKQESGKPEFDGRELSSIMFKMDYVTMKAKEKGLPVPKMTSKHQTGSVVAGSAGGNNMTFNAFKELAAIEAGKKQYAGVPASSKASEQVEDEGREIEYEGNKLQVNKDGTLKNLEELKNYRPNMALGFQLQGDAPSNYREARVDFKALKKDLSEGDLVCNVVHLTPKDPTKGTVGFEEPISDEQYTQIQSKGIKSGGRTVAFTRLSDEDYKQFHIDCATLRAKSKLGSKDKDPKSHKRDNDARRGGRRGDRNGKRHQNGGRGGDRNAEKSQNKNPESQTGEENKSNPANVVGTKRDAEGNVISTSGGTANSASANSVPEIGRAEKKPKTAA